MLQKLCGIYKITCTASGQSYIGSSVNIILRWREHRRLLRKGRHHNERLQAAWNQHSEGSFQFSIVEECSRMMLWIREQHHLDSSRPEYNVAVKVGRRTKDKMHRPIDAAARARADLITHCPRGHAYDEKNTYRGRTGKRICRACNAARAFALYSKQTPEQREQEKLRMKTQYQANRTVRLAKAKDYALVHKAEKRAYDQRRRAEMQS
jgi:group I intron endonuclease